MASKLYLGSIDPMKIDKSKIKTFTRRDGTEGKSIDVTIWVEDNPSEDWKAVSIQQSTTKDEANIYLGNCKEYISRDAPQGRMGAVENESPEKDDLPF